MAAPVALTRSGSLTDIDEKKNAETDVALADAYDDQYADPERSGVNIKKLIRKVSRLDLISELY